MKNIALGRIIFELLLKRKKKLICFITCISLKADRDRRGFYKYIGTEVIIRVSLIGNKRKSSC